MCKVPKWKGEKLDTNKCKEPQQSKQSDWKCIGVVTALTKKDATRKLFNCDYVAGCERVTKLH